VNLNKKAGLEAEKLQNSVTGWSEGSNGGKPPQDGDHRTGEKYLCKEIKKENWKENDVHYWKCNEFRLPTTNPHFRLKTQCKERKKAQATTWASKRRRHYQSKK